MAILANKDTKVIVQGITGGQGSFHTRLMIDYGTQVVGGVVPGKGGEWFDNDIPVFDTVADAVNATGATTTMVIVPPPFAPDGVIEAVDAGLELIVCLTEHIPVKEMMKVYHYVQRSGKSRLLGPNCPGLLVPGQMKIGFIPDMIAKPGNVGVVSKSGTLTYEVGFALKNYGMGQSTIVGIGGDPVIGTSFVDILQMYESDPETEKVVLLGEIGGNAEILAADFIKNNMTKPVAAFIAGQSAPPGKRMGHAGAIVEGGEGTAEEKIAALEDAGVRVAKNPEEIPALLAK
ncbi:MAG: succinate--CoA ligase subunit alpha [Anaerolineae bacterium]|nr:succinate--CoA ligase subunit alpha [Anaerolineae bacterium]